MKNIELSVLVHFLLRNLNRIYRRDFSHVWFQKLQHAHIIYTGVKTVPSETEEKNKHYNAGKDIC